MAEHLSTQIKFKNHIFFFRYILTYFWSVFAISINFFILNLLQFDLGKMVKENIWNRVVIYLFFFILFFNFTIGEDNGTPLQYSCLENPMDGRGWWAAVHGVAKSRTRLSDFTFTFHLNALEKEMATHSSVLAWRIPETG